MADGTGSNDAVATVVAGDGGDLSVIHLLDRLSTIEQRVRAEIQRRRAEADGDRDGDDARFRGLYVSDQRADDLLEQGPAVALEPDELTRRWLLQIEAHAEAVEEAGTTMRLRQLARAFDLASLDIELLLVALAPDIDQRFEGLYGYLNDDVSLRRATVGLALRMCGISPASGRGRERLGPAAPRVRSSRPSTPSTPYGSVHRQPASSSRSGPARSVEPEATGPHPPGRVEAPWLSAPAPPTPQRPGSPRRPRPGRPPGRSGRRPRWSGAAGRPRRGSARASVGHRRG